MLLYLALGASLLAGSKAEITGSFADDVALFSAADKRSLQYYYNGYNKGGNYSKGKGRYSKGKGYYYKGTSGCIFGQFVSLMMSCVSLSRRIVLVPSQTLRLTMCYYRKG